MTGPVFRRILTLLRPHWKWVVGFLITIALTSSLDAYFTFLNKEIVDTGITLGNKDRVLNLAMIYGGFILLQSGAVFTFIYVWNDFLAPLVYLHSENKATLAVALNSYRNQYGGLEDVHYLMAASVVTMIPCIVLFCVAQRELVEGLGRGAVKG